MNKEPLSDKFQAELIRTVEESKRYGYVPTRFLQMIYEEGGIATARKLLSRNNDFQEGLTKLWELKRLDLSMEAVVIRPEYSALFRPEEIAVARERLEGMGYRE